MTVMRKMLGGLVLPLGALVVLSGCSTMAPKYSRPEAPVPAAWPTGAAYTSQAAAKDQKPLAEVPWQEFFVDPQLRKVIELALNNNRDLRVAVLNIERTRALYQIQRADLFPQIDASAEANYQGIPKDFSSTGSHRTSHQYTAGLGAASYELDLFGRVRSLKDQALEEFLATQQARRAVQISLVSQVATSYLTLAADRERLRIAQGTLANQQASFDLTKSRFAAGVASALDLSQAQTSVEAARVDIARYTTLIAQDENALNLVVGSVVPDELKPTQLAATMTGVKDLTPGLPSDVLLNRPDILQAEAQLKGANANIGAARAAFFPRIALTTSVGIGSNSLSGLFKGGALAWQFAPQVSLPIFDGGFNKANLKASEVERDIMVAQYEKAIQTAFREVADALAQRGTIEDQLAAQQALTNANSESLRLSQARYERGIDNYLNVLVSQRSLYDSQQSLISVVLARLNNMVSFYKVVGGGANP
ncbi:adeC/adeK/oprM family multidrug efflux complex outer membrane factor [Geomonas silvestris]|uniref:AdeC/adeK/oprM family multidrug efflux complex outer membrane factor n=1 Tax=Geomonas silvestris TaxID=2740184 RepID=A0A6V8MGG0_9BACT|nr:AdeC/AdeK/OprM family multidrug efflux complex outer membrane factor [Geomonas silvestris]GFO58769.1 adeC/adeK/oprM family multidrug efflux complex outer membrane factor [Geomonas silvestris]